MGIMHRLILTTVKGIVATHVGIGDVLFWCRARVANRRTEYLKRLATCVRLELDSSSSRMSVRWNTIMLPGYIIDSKTRERLMDIYWEAPVCITTYIDEKPLCGMAVEFRGPHLYIRQLQGEAGARIPDELRDWPARFVRAAQNFLCNTEELVSVRLYAAHKRWSYYFPCDRDGNPIRMSPEELSEHRKRLRRRYDGTARSMGFTKLNDAFYEWRSPTEEQQTAD